MLNLQKKTSYLIVLFSVFSSFFCFKAAAADTNFLKNLTPKIIQKKCELPSFNNARTVTLTSLEKTNILCDKKIKDISGKEISISNFKKNFVIVALTTTWCPHCPRALKNLDDFALKNLNGVTIISLMVSPEEEKLSANDVKLHYYTHDIRYLDVYESVSPDFLEEIKGVPSFLIFAPNGEFLGAYIGCPDFNSEKFIKFCKEKCKA